MRGRHSSGEASNISRVETCSYLLRQLRKEKKEHEKYEPFSQPPGGGR